MSVERIIHVYKHGLCTLSIRTICKNGKCELEEQEIDKLIEYLMQE